MLVVHVVKMSLKHAPTPINEAKIPIKKLAVEDVLARSFASLGSDAAQSCHHVVRSPRNPIQPFHMYSHSLAKRVFKTAGRQ